MVGKSLSWIFAPWVNGSGDENKREKEEKLLVRWSLRSARWPDKKAQHLLLYTYKNVESGFETIPGKPSDEYRTGERYAGHCPPCLNIFYQN